MAITEEDTTWVCTAHIQNDLIKLHERDKKKWQRSITKMIREHPSKFSILTVGVEDDGDNLYTFDEFSSHFNGTIDNQKLLQLIYNDLDHHDETHIKIPAIHRWVSQVKLQKDDGVIKDHKWMFTKILHVQAEDLDDDESGEIDRDEFTEYFVEKVGFPETIAHAIFDDIDINGDGDLTVMEYTKWKKKHNKPDKLKKFLDKIQKRNRDKIRKNKTKKIVIDDEKCPQCAILSKELQETKQKLATWSYNYQQMEVEFKSINSKHSNLIPDYKECPQCAILSKELQETKQEIPTLNCKYQQMELEFNSINSKHLKLLQDHGKISKLLDEEKEKHRDKIESQKQNGKLTDEAKIKTTEIINMKYTLKSFEKENKGLKDDILKERKQEITTLNNNYQQMELKFKSINNKHSNLLQDYDKLSKLLNEKHNGSEADTDMDKPTDIINMKYKLQSFEKENKRLKGDIEGLEDDRNAQKRVVKDLKEKVSKLEMNVQLRDEDMERLKAQLNDRGNDDGNTEEHRNIEIYQRENKELNEKINEQKNKIKELQRGLFFFCM